MSEELDENKVHLDAKEALLERHRLEKKELNAKITDMKHKTPKGDKKKQKELKNEITLMTEELTKRHENELKSLSTTSSDLNTNDETINGLTNQLTEIKVNTKIIDNNVDSDLIDNGIKYSETKVSKAQRRRDAKALKEKQKQQRIAEDMVDDSENQRLIELDKLKNILSSRGLVMYDIPSDGDCMYRAIEHQLSLNNIKTNVSELRQKTCDYMKTNKLDYIPFLTSNTGDLMNDEEYDGYCNDIATTKSWGGQLELRAISHIFRIAIEVIQTEGSPVLIGDTDYRGCKSLIVCYLRYAYSLGEHYNSVQQK
ncbi:deubiquitinase OTUD6B-like [Oppia nitens]|uniref:deubiquitinase OTUD6B-like n=1 Tax=Oppia nitens TaxID=1686743 RepID=UPI0023DB7A90|nr:deubiquitinase OTUD6B-like [Oppia nitens]